MTSLLGREPRCWPLVRAGREAALYIGGLPDPVEGTPGDYLLLVIYAAGDCDTIQADGEKLHRALYDARQVHDGLQAGDTFSLDGKVLYRCDGIGVVKVEA